MSEILVEDLKDLVDKTEYVKKVEFKELDMEIRLYLPMKEKLKLAESVYQTSLDKVNGFEVVNKNTENIALVHFITKYYTNIELPEDIFEGFDMIVSTGIFNKLIETIETEINGIMEMVYFIGQKNEESFIKKEELAKRESGLGSAIKELPEILKQMMDVVKDTDPKVLEGLRMLSGK